MNKKDCDIVKDLLPSYSDGLTSQETNSFIEEHLKKCDECKNMLKNMNKKIDLDENIDQTKEVKYLKGFKTRRNLIVVISIILTICICIGVILIRVPLDTDKFNVEWMYMTSNEQNSGEKTLQIYISTEYNNIVVTGESEFCDGEKEINIKLKGGIPNGLSGGYYGIYTPINISEETEKIYIEGAWGKKKLIWSKDMEVMTKENWENWYTEEYVPQKLKDVYGIYYKDKNGNIQWISTPEWRIIYNKFFNN